MRLPSQLREDSLTLLARGYDMGEQVWQRVRSGARAAPMRLLGRPALLVRGADGVALFYDEDRIAREGAMPPVVQATLFGTGSVHSLDGAAHRHRKATFLRVAYDDAQRERLAPLFEEEWNAELDAWIAGGTRSAYDAGVGAFGRASMRWAGLPGTPVAMTRWSHRLAQIVDGFGAPYAPRYVAATVNRWWSDRHSARLIEAARSGRLRPQPGTALAEWAEHRDPEGALLPADLAGKELQNSIRPTIAVARFVAFAAKALHDHPEWRPRIAEETRGRGRLVGGPLATAFAQEVRRTAPFVPMLPGWATTDLKIDGETLDAGGRVLLDLLGTNTDQLSWADADRFDPERFVGVDDYEAIAAFVPHGGADVATGHRCPGEKLAIDGLAAAIAALSDPRVEVGGRLSVDRRRLPTMPASGGIVRARSTARGCPVH